VSQLEAAELLGMSDRTLPRKRRRFEEEREEGLLDRRLGGAPAGRFSTMRPKRSSGFTASVTGTYGQAFPRNIRFDEVRCSDGGQARRTYRLPPPDDEPHHGV
jgi:hypothetical protein